MLRQLRGTLGLILWSLGVLFIIPACFYLEKSFIHTAFTLIASLVFAAALFSYLRAKRKEKSGIEARAIKKIMVIRGGVET